MKVEEIPSDKLVVMTKFWHKAFNTAGCNPMCHCCMRDIKIGEKFKLATVETNKTDSANSGISLMAKIESREVMLCQSCSVEDMNKMTKINKEKYEEYRNSGGGCFRVNGKIIH